jgi:FtsP/CotA-like multicopper oxidase with cupredoxin domain
MQQNFGWEDGVPSVSMCPIAPGCSFTQTFKATPYGSTFYHSHYSSQYADGLWGPMIIHGPTNEPYDIDLGPVTLNDYYHTPYYDILKGVVGPINPNDLRSVRPASDNNLINGKMNFVCPDASSNSTEGSCVNNAGVSKFNFVSGKKHRLRLINSGIAAIQKFSIDGHNMTVFANDFIPIEPYTTNVVTLGVSLCALDDDSQADEPKVGQRSDVVVEATGNPEDIYWMRSKISSGECTEPANQPLALATIYYEKANKTGTPGTKSVAQVDNTPPCENDALSKTVPAYPIAASNPATTIDMAVNFKINATGHLVWTINDSAFRANFNNPLLLLANAGNDSYPYDPEWNVYNVGSNASVRIILTNQSPTSHPWHVHGHEM